jgi:hypothetical protein
MPLFNPALGVMGVSPRTPVTANNQITTTSATYVLATNMTDTPPAGTYLVIFGGSTVNDNTGAGLYVGVSIYAGGSLVADSERRMSDSVNFDQMFCIVSVVTVDGSQAVEGRWLRTAGAGTAYMNGPRCLYLLQIA